MYTLPLFTFVKRTIWLLVYICWLKNVMNVIYKFIFRENHINSYRCKKDIE
jgi:hypothetical protein